MLTKSFKTLNILGILPHNSAYIISDTTGYHLFNGIGKFTPLNGVILADTFLVLFL